MSDPQTVTVTLTSQDIKSLHATPFEVISAQGVDTVIEVLSTSAKFIYGGASPFTNPQSIFANYGDIHSPSIVSNLINSSVVGGTSTAYGNGPSNGYNGTRSAGTVDNKPVTININGVTEITGNAANDNSIVITMTYVIHSLT